MSEIACYHFNGFTLSIDSYSFLVFVRFSNQVPEILNTVEDLPAWVFQSRLAIWLIESETSMLDRSLGGDKIKQYMLEMKAFSS